MDEKARASRVCSLHAVDIFAFVQAEDVPFPYFDTPYYLTPAPEEEKAYALLRETLGRSSKIGIACVTIRARRYLAALVPCGSSLVLNTLRCRAKVRRDPDLRLPPDHAGKIEVSEEELAATARLVDSMTRRWDMSQLHGTLRDHLISRIQHKVREGKTTGLSFESDCAKPRQENVSDSALASLLISLAGVPQRRSRRDSRAAHDREPKPPLIRWRRMAA